MKQSNFLFILILKYENKKIPEDFDYNKYPGLSLEAKQKLSRIKPVSIAQAMRIPGVRYADISTLLLLIKKYYKEKV